MKDIPGYEGRYAATQEGKIWAFPNKSHKKEGKWVEGWVRNGYRMVTIDYETLRLHRLIAQTFLPNPLDLPFVNHLNGIKLDNRVENLEWCTAQRNVQHAFETGLMPIGSARSQSVINEQEALEIKILLKSKRITFDQIAQLYGVSRGVIERIHRGTAWKNIQLPAHDTIHAKFIEEPGG